MPPADRGLVFVSGAPGAPPPDLSWSRRLGAAAMELLWRLAADAPVVILEANFRPNRRYEREKLAALARRPVEVYCQCDPQLAARRYDVRAIASAVRAHLAAPVPEAS